MGAELLAAATRFIESVEAWEAATVTARDQAAYADVANTVNERLASLSQLAKTLRLKDLVVDTGYALAPLLTGDAAGLHAEYMALLRPAAIDRDAAAMLWPRLFGELVKLKACTPADEKAQRPIGATASPPTENLAKLLERAGLALGETGGRILAIANSARSADVRMREIAELDAAAYGWRSPRWAALLNVSEPAIRKTNFWKTDRAERFAAARALYAEKYPDQEPPAELQTDAAE